MMDIPPGWQPQPQTSIDPQLECDLKDIKDDEPTRLEFIKLKKINISSSQLRKI